MGLVYHKKQDEKETSQDTLDWYDYYRDKVLAKPATEVETEIVLPDEDNATIRISNTLNNK